MKKENPTSKALHATMVNVDQTGALLLGEAGIGKSQLALGLIDRGHQLIADDWVQLEKINQQIHAACPQKNQQMLFVRSIGLLNIVKLYGKKHFQEICKLDLIIELKNNPNNQGPKIDFYPVKTFHPILGVPIPSYQLFIHQNQNLPLLVELLIKTIALQQRGYHTTEDFLNRKIND